MSVRSYLDAHPQLGERVYIDPDATVIGQVTLADDVSVWPGAVLRGDVERIRIGARSNIQDGAICHVTHDGPYSPGGASLVIAQEVTVGHRAVLHACRIGARCLIGMGALVLDDAVLDDEVMLGAGALVAPGKHLEGGWLYVGSPARPARPLRPAEREFLAYSAAHYVRMKDRYLAA
ncbi:gamma carbonic anhydrase family protein [Candidatus Macondimonas diazotrophica]|jgi:carbonic anhydrase/acetyltransferase-like protein (isoleucine patch superfamily)|uniref:Gamma carbonic anhydrase family protein n=1 Tax=Candidatus Macondimonas diazotrophica TaxID=2305248 RepID=A0A4Z0FBW7_9GAMM|nr:gamma carbonic anhydrase family protein [Candidatus Macondimonas diazotrophica]NCU01941.1 gamma carbonic anhydrase family protein [Candidatus Macondimonas diazotrophica]TFZ84016.1 gamma carbonic anhydrase family protein [Candidatus Macondimonas diazotrophica]HBG51008.1 gamma carbonic anhydrase family protein [Gammaproteobacteria bacterium]